MFRDKGYGFIRTPDEREIYFNDASVVNGGFKRLGSGSEVRFVLAPDDGPEGPQASTVKLIGKHHLVEQS
jgi:cold shock CspA family protein